MSMDENFTWETEMENGARLQVAPIVAEDEGKIVGLMIGSVDRAGVGRSVMMSIEAAELYLEGMVEVIEIVKLGREVEARLEN